MTNIDNTMHIITSSSLSVKIDAAPNKVVHTSPDKFDDVEYTLIRKYPIASAPTETTATAASPLIFEFSPIFKSNTAHMMVTGKTNTVLLVTPNIEDTAIAPNAAWDKPSPI